jgi:MFS family permease
MSRYFRYTLLRYFKDYYYIEKPVLNVIAAEFFVQIINVAFLSIQLIYMQKAGYSDHASAGFIACRFLGVLILAIPLGIYIRGKKILPLFYVAGLVVPSAAVLIIVATDYHFDLLLYFAQFLWGMGFTFIQTPVLPYILRNCEKRTQTSAIALSYSTFSFGGIISGVFVYILYAIDPIIFSERNLLLALSLFSFVGIYFLHKVKTEEIVPFDNNSKKRKWGDYDWKIIINALLPTLIIAVGAGLTIPFIGIFFFNVHHVSTGSFSLLNGIASILVAVSAMLVPYIKKSIGYKIAIPATQSFAVLALVLLATTQFYAHLGIALYIAILCFMLRQPLMNMAGPMTSELVMKYTGKRNQEMVSALTAAIWSGSWFISSLIFKLLRSSSWSYVYIFLITAFLYGIGVIWYYYLILDYNKRQKSGLISEGD